MKTKSEQSSGGIVYKKDGNSISWLICKHSLLKTWGFPKGLIGDTHNAESMETAAVREVREETGVNAAIKHAVPIEIHYSYSWRGSPHGKNSTEDVLVEKTVYYFLMEYVSGNTTDHDFEMDEARFVSSDDAQQTLTHKAEKEALQKALSIFHDKHL